MSGVYRITVLALAGAGLLACGDETSATETEADAEGSSTGATTSDGDDAGDDAPGRDTGDPGPAPDDGADESGGGKVPPPPGCGNGQLDPGEVCDDGNDDAFDGCLPDCTAIEPLDPPELKWTYYEVEDTQCLDGSPAGFGVSYAPDSPNVMIYLEGGGACFNDACDFTAFAAPFSPPGDGIFARTEGNPVGDWTMVYVPYCTGDIHAGSNDTELGGQMRHFHGYDNLQRFLQLLIPSLPMPETVLLTGSSAGGFGAALNAAPTATAYGDDVHLVVLDDSGPPMSSAVMPPCLQDVFRQTWNLDATVLADCPGCDPHDFARDLLDNVVAAHPNVDFGLYSTTGDLVIRTYMGFGWGFGQHDNCGGVPTAVPGSAFQDDLLQVRDAYAADISTFYRYGLDHTVLRPAFSTTSVDGTSLAQWLGDVLAGERVHVGP